MSVWGQKAYIFRPKKSTLCTLWGHCLKLSVWHRENCCLRTLSRSFSTYQHHHMLIVCGLSLSSHADVFSVKNNFTCFQKKETKELLVQSETWLILKPKKKSGAHSFRHAGCEQVSERFITKHKNIHASLCSHILRQFVVTTWHFLSWSSQSVAHPRPVTVCLCGVFVILNVRKKYTLRVFVHWEKGNTTSTDSVTISPVFHFQPYLTLMRPFKGKFKIFCIIKPLFECLKTTTSI